MAGDIELLKLNTKDLTTQIVAWGESGDEVNVYQLLGFLGYEDGNVRRLACSALGKIGSNLAERPLMAMLFDDKPQVRQYAIKALRSCGTDACLPAMEKIIKTENEEPYNQEAAQMTMKVIKNRKRMATGETRGSRIKSGMTEKNTTSITPQKPKSLHQVELRPIKNRIKLSDDQWAVVKSLVEWLRKPDSQFITAGGYAGTGKTTLIGVLRQMMHESAPEVKVAFACYTGKASQVLKTKLLEQGAFRKQDFCGTIHQLMYSPKLDKDGKIAGWTRNKSIKHDLIIVDEASMVTAEIWQDLMKYGIYLIAIGDHGQLPPIGDGFNLMEKPQLRLEKIHRHAAGNPIIEVATLARMQGKIPHMDFNSRVKKIKKGTEEEAKLVEDIFSSFDEQTLILCGRNRTRVRLNQAIRKHLGYESSEPVAGERLICLKNNYENPEGPIFNGMVGELVTIKPHKKHWYEADIYFSDEGRGYEGLISRYQFNQERYIESVPGIHYREIGDRFDFGYALTVHKAQGSQANRVLLFEEPCSHWPGELWNRWLYTAVTRAVEELYIIGE